MAEQNYSPNIFLTPFSSPATQCVGGNCSGHGSPPADFGFPGYTYLDLDTDEFWSKNASGWVLVTAGGGSGAGLTFHQGSFTDPNGHVTGTVGDVYKSRESTGGDGSVWWKLSGNGTDTGWA